MIFTITGASSVDTSTVLSLFRKGRRFKYGDKSMNFPDTALISFLYAVINTPSIGGIVVGVLATGIAFSVGLTLRWIAQGGQVDEPEVYAYPTPALHAQHDEEELQPARRRGRRRRLTQP
jgi:hypothetical protein